jgi:oligoribonuclease
MDLEMTGLDPESDTIIEAATIITAGDLEIIEEGTALAIHQPPAVLDAMDKWNTEHHAASGLTARITASTLSMAQAEAQTLELIKRHVGERAAPLCGNSIWQDRRFLARYMPTLEAYLHYRIVDVSSIKELVRRWYPEEPVPTKKNTHLALEDIRESIAELRHYREKFFR